MEDEDDAENEPDDEEEPEAGDEGGMMRKRIVLTSFDDGESP